MTIQQTQPSPQAIVRRSPLSYFADIFRGFLIGMAELVPGISGGTVALIVGIYEKVLHNANLLVKRQLRTVEWGFLACVALGMVAAVGGMSTVMHGFVTNYTALANALFLGMVIVSIIVPVGMMDSRTATWKLIALFIPAAVLAFIGTGYTSTPVENPSLLVVFIAAIVAVTALMIPGVSGSYILLALGLYEPVLGAVSERDMKIVAVFGLGAITGAVLFIKALKWLMDHHRNVTLAVMAGLMVGSLRGLWPWANAEVSNNAAIVGMIFLGGAIVAVFLIVDRWKSSGATSRVIVSAESSS